MPTINDLRLQAATIKNATQVGENTATRVGTTFETIADLLEQQGVGQGVPSVDLSQLNTLRTPADQTTANPTIYNVTTLHNLSSTTIKVGTLFIFSDGGRAVVTQVLLSNYQVDGGGNISSPNASQITMYYRMFNIMQETWSAWTLYGGGGGGGTIDPYPVSGSSNAVESNGVFEGLQKAAPEVDINYIDDLDDFVDMQTGVASTYTIKAYHNLSSTWLRVGVLMVFANQANNTLTQICISNCMVDGGGNLIPNYTTNAMNVFYRFKQFSGVPPEGMTIGVWTTWAKFGDSGYQPDNEDIDLNASDQLQFANKSYDASAFSGLGRVYLRKNIVTSGGVEKNVLTQAMVNTANTIYHIQYDYDLNGQTITLPAGCVLEFAGGSLANGYLNLNNAELRGDVNITAEPAWDETNEFWENYKPSNLALNVSWFGAKADGVSDDAPAIKRCIKWLHKNGATMVFDLKGTYILGDGVKDLTNDPNMTLHTGYSYDPTSAVMTGDWTGISDRGAYIAAHPANIGRDISLRFFRFTNLTIEGNGVTIKSHDGNGYCKHNELFRFDGCDYLKVRDITIDANRDNRPDTWNCLGDYGFGAEVETYAMLQNDSLYDVQQLTNTWGGGVGTRDVSAGYRQVQNLVFVYCNFASVENIVSIGSLMDGLNFNGFAGYLPHDLFVKKSTFEHSSRHNSTIGGANACLIEDCVFQYAGLKEDETTALWGSTCSNIDLEGEIGVIENIVVRNSVFRKTARNAFVITTDTRYCLIDGCRFEGSGINPRYNNGCFKNEIKNCTFINCTCPFYQEGINVHHNQFLFNDYAGAIIDIVIFGYDASFVYGKPSSNTASIVPSRFCNNYIECKWTQSATATSPLIRVEGNYEINDNVFVNVQGSSLGAILAYCKSFVGNRFMRDTTTYPWLVGGVSPHVWKFLEGEANIQSINDGVSTNVYGYKSQLKANGCVEYYITTNATNNPFWMQLSGIKAEIEVFTIAGSSVKANYYKTSKGGWDGVFGSYENPTTAITFTGYYHHTNAPYIKIESVALINIHIVIYQQNKTTIDNAIILASAPSTSGYQNFKDVNPVVDALPSYNKWVESHAILSKNLHKMCIKAQGDGFYTHDGWPATLNTWGTTSQRPTLTADEEGFEYYDKTLHKPIWWNGSDWIDATGAVV